MESALRLPEIIKVVASYTGYKNAVSAASLALRRGWDEAEIASPRIFVFSEVNPSVLAFDLRKCKWTEMSPIPFFDAATTQRIFKCVDVDDLDGPPIGFFVIGQARDDVWVLVQSPAANIFKYNMRTDTWTDIAKVPEIDWNAQVLAGDHIYFIDCENDTEEHRPTTVTRFNLKSGVFSSVDFNLPWDFTGDGLSVELIASDGFIHTTEFETDSDNLARQNCWKLDLDTMVWTSRPDAPSYWHRAVSRGNEIVILGGVDFTYGHRLASANVWKLGEDSSVWTRLPSMSTGRLTPGAVIVEGSICVFGGTSGWESGDEDESSFDSAEELDLTTRRWKPLPRMPHKMGNCFSTLLS